MWVKIELDVCVLFCLFVLVGVYLGVIVVEMCFDVYGFVNGVICNCGLYSEEIVVLVVVLED